MTFNKIKLVVYVLSITISACTKDNISESIIEENQSVNSTSLNRDISNGPLLIWSAASQPNPSKITPAIFYTPHQDDETIGMGASIAEHVRVGRPVYVVLLSNGANMGMLQYLKTLKPNSTMKDVIHARNNEFIAACKSLGVHRIYIANMGNGYNEAVPIKKLRNEFKNTITYMRNLFPVASHKTVSGNCDSYNPNCRKMPTHQAATAALHELYNAGIVSDVRLYRVYCYYKNYGSCDRMANWQKPINYSDRLKRQCAINQYRYVNVSTKRFGLGYWHSVRTLFDNLWHSPYEYVDYLENDY